MSIEPGVLHESERTRVWAEPSGAGTLVVKAPIRLPVLHDEVEHYQRAVAVAEVAAGLTPRVVLELRAGVPHLVGVGVPGKTFAEVARSNIDLGARIAHAAALADTVAAFHDRGLVHRDLRADDCLLRADNTVVLLDLDTAESLDRRRLAGRAAPTARAGGAEAPIDPRADLQAVGGILHELLRDRATGDGAEQLDHIVDRLCARRLDDGYQSAGVLARDLRRCLNSLTVTGSVAPFEVAREQMSPVLDLDGVVVGRDVERDRLADVYERVSRSGGTLALVEGAAGVGKSALVAQFAIDAAAQGAVVARGKFEPDAAEPYSAIAQALSELVRTMLGSTPTVFEMWANELEAQVRPSAAALLPLVPDLEVVLGPVDSLPSLAATEARARLHRALAGLVEATAAVQPVVVAIDDLQWADSDSLLAIGELLELVSRNLLVVGTFRDGEFDASQLDGHDPLRLSLGGLDDRAVRAFIVATLGESPNLAEVSNAIAERTAGNPLFVKELVRRAQHDGALRYESVTGQWHWDLDALAKLPVSDSVVDLLLMAFNHLPAERADILSDAACIGRRFSIPELVAASGSSGSTVAETIWDALDLRLIEPVAEVRRRLGVVDTSSVYRFTHDRVAEAALDRVSGERRQQAHLRFGRHLVEQSGPVFEMARHFNEALMLLDDDDERRRLVTINAEAANEAIARSSFPLARSFFEAAIELMGPGGWHRDPELAADLHLGATETSLLVGDTSRAHEWIDTARTHLLPASSQQAGRLAILRMRALVAEQRLNEALDTAVAALAERGHDVRGNPNRRHAGQALLSARMMLRSVDPDTLVERPSCDDPEPLLTLELLTDAINVAYIIRPEMFPDLVKRSVALTLAHGIMPLSAVGFAHYGVLLSAALGDVTGAHRWGQAAMALADDPRCAASWGAVRWLYFNFVHPWVAPVGEAIPQLLEAHRRALENGDLEVAAWAGVVGMYFSLNQGLPLSEIDTLAARLTPPIRSQRVQTRLCQSTQQMALNLMGRSESPFLLAGESGYDERLALPAAEEEGDTVSLAAAAVTKLGIRFWYGDHEGVLDLVPAAQEHLDGMAGTLNVPNFVLMQAVATLEVDPKSRQARRIIARARRRYAKWAKHCPANYRAAHLLISGLAEAAKGRPVDAEVHLDEAIAAADEARMPHHGALAREALARVYDRSGRRTLSRMLLRDAHDQWRSIGYLARSARLESEHPWLVQADMLARAPIGDDVQEVFDATQAISGEVQLDALLSRLVERACELTDASGALLYLVTDDGLRCKVMRRSDTTSTLDEPAIGVGPATLIRYVERSQRPLRLDDVSASALASDPNVRERNTRSTLTIPVMRGAQVVAVLHVEHDTDPRAFTTEHQQALMLLAGQLGVSLENVELVARLEAALDSQESLAAAQSRFIPNEILRIFETDDIRTVRVGDTVERDMSILVSDIRGYTRLVESLSLSEAGKIAIDFLQLVEPAIIGNDGYVQDMRGDEVLALFGGSCDDAVRAALAMRQAQQVQNARRVEIGLDPVLAGIGLTAGTVMLTMVGGINRMTCGVIGDAVNLAARIEGLNKRYGTGLLASQVLIDGLECPGDFHFRRMERVRVVNRAEPVTVHEIFDHDPPELFDRKCAASALFDEAFAAFDAGDFVGAARTFEECERLLPGDAVARLHLEECRRAIASGAVDLRFVELSEK